MILSETTASQRSRLPLHAEFGDKRHTFSVRAALVTRPGRRQVVAFSAEI